MKNLKLICLLFCLFLTIFIFNNCGTGQKAFEKEILKLFPNSKITWSREFSEERVSFKASKNCIVISTKNGKQKKLTFVNFKDSTDWSPPEEVYPYRWYDLVGKDKDQLLILKSADECRSESYVFDKHGKQLFKVSGIEGLTPSPNGKYYFTKASLDCINNLWVYNNKGEEIWKFKTYPGLWQVEALSDSSLIYFDFENCFLFNPFTGKEIWRISFTQFHDAIMAGPDFAPSKNGDYFILFNGWAIFSMNKSGKILWKKNKKQYTVSLSDDGRFVGVYGKDDKSAPKTLSLLDNFNGGELIWSVVIDANLRDCRNNIGGVRFIGDKIYLLPGISSFFCTGIYFDPKWKRSTYIFEFDPSTGKLLKQNKYKGVLQVIEVAEKKAYFLTIDKSGHKHLCRIEENN